VGEAAEAEAEAEAAAAAAVLLAPAALERYGGSSASASASGLLRGLRAVSALSGSRKKRNARRQLMMRCMTQRVEMLTLRRHPS
jgi:hypothetical protein